MVSEFRLNHSFQVHCVWAAAEAYSAPSIVLTSHSQDGLHVFDDFREAYAWLSHNTEVDDKVRNLPLTEFSYLSSLFIAVIISYCKVLLSDCFLVGISCHYIMIIIMFVS